MDRRVVTAREIEAQTELDLAEEQAKLDAERIEEQMQLRALEIVADQFRSRLERLQNLNLHCTSEMTDAEEVKVFDGSHQQPREFIKSLQNPLCPYGQVERYKASWVGSSCFADVITIEKPESGQPELPTCHHRESARQGSKQKRRIKTQDDPQRWMSWVNALRNELRLIKLLRHPNIEPVYGATADRLEGRIIMLLQPSGWTMKEFLLSKMVQSGEQSPLSIDSHHQRLGLHAFYWRCTQAFGL